MKINILIKCGLVTLAIGAFVILGIVQWSLFQQQNRIEISIHDLEKQLTSFNSLNSPALNELHLKLEKYKSSIEESLKEINKKNQDNYDLLQASLDETINTQNELETFFKEKIEIVFEEINIIKSKTTENKKNTYSEKYQEVSQNEKRDCIDLLIKFTNCIELKKIDKLQDLFSKDAVCIFDGDLTPKSRDEYINHIKNKFLKIEKIKLKPRGWAVLKLRESGNYHLRLPLGYSSSSMKHEENGLIDCFMEIKHQGTKLKIDYIEEKISNE